MAYTRLHLLLEKLSMRCLTDTQDQKLCGDVHVFDRFRSGKQPWYIHQLYVQCLPSYMRSVP